MRIVVMVSFCCYELCNGPMSGDRNFPLLGQHDKARPPWGRPKKTPPPPRNLTDGEPSFRGKGRSSKNRGPTLFNGFERGLASESNVEHYRPRLALHHGCRGHEGGCCSPFAEPTAKTALTVNFSMFALVLNYSDWLLEDKDYGAAVAMLMRRYGPENPRCRICGLPWRARMFDLAPPAGKAGTTSSAAVADRSSLGDEKGAVRRPARCARRPRRS